MDQPMRQERDLVLPPNTFAYVLDTTKGRVSAYVGPFKSSLSNTDQLVVWREGRFIASQQMEEAVQSFVEAGEGQYVVLTNPNHTDIEQFPSPGMSNDAIGLDTGRKIVIPGPTSFPLWPGQAAQVIDGHHLRHNQYLVVRVYEPQAAAENADRARVAFQRTGETGETEVTDEEKTGEEESTPTLDSNLTMGQLSVIKGEDVSFYVPPTGIEVVPEDSAEVPSARTNIQARPGSFVREAATLEQLEYCVLLDENGRKRFEQGPAVVFPKPTERFATDESGSRKFRAIELNPQSGLYIKVIAPYEDPDGTRHSEGEELFLTGDHTPIYFPRVEHSIIQYGDRRKHHAIAIPKGEGRYVLDRTRGEVSLVTGPKMFLPDPRREVIVRRILDPDTVAVMYPGNDEARQVNEQYQEEQAAKARHAGGLTEGVEDYLLAEESATFTSKMMRATPAATFGGEKMRRGTEYTPPRMITLDTKYEGAVTVSIWPGYAILVMDKSGNRRVELGPVNVLLKYDESLMMLALSTGRPKSDYSKLRTPYLRTINNSVSDRVTVETRDLVPVTLDLSLRVNFEGEEDRTRWFDVEDYVALLTDHCRSKLRNLAKRYDIQDFYTQTIDLIRDGLLGSAEEGGRPGLPFVENGMRLYDVEVLGVKIETESVERLLAGAMDESLRGAIRLSQAERETEREAQLEQFERERLREREKTREADSLALISAIERQGDQASRQAEYALTAVAERARVNAIQRAEVEAEAHQSIDLLRERNNVELARLDTEVAQLVERMKAIEPGLIQAISQFGDQAFVEKLVEAVGPVALTTGVTTADAFKQIFEGTPFEGIMNSLAQRPFAIANGSRQEEKR